MKKKQFAISKEILALSRMEWRPEYHGTVDNPTVPGGKVAMWLIVDDETGEGIVSIGCPPDRPDIPAYIAFACTNPWLTVTDDGQSMTGLAVEFNRAIVKHYAKDGMADAQDITIAAMTIIEGYLTDVPARARVDLVNNISARLQTLRNGA